MRHKNRFLIVFSVLLLFTACNAVQSQAPDNTLAKVNGEPITEDDVYLALNNVHERESNPEARSRAIDDLIDQELLYQQGMKLGLDKDPKYHNMVRIMEMRLRQFKRAEMARRVASTRIAAAVEVTANDVAKYYAENEAAISNDFRFLMIQFPDEDAARTAYQQMQRGTSFEAVAGGLKGPGAAGAVSPRDSGFLHWSQIPVEWTLALAAMPKGQISGVLCSPGTAPSILKLTDIRKNPDATPEGMNASIANRVRDVLIADAYKRYIQDLRRGARIVKHEERRNPS